MDSHQEDELSSSADFDKLSSVPEEPLFKATIIEEVGDIFKSPPDSILIHACNARGAWGSGVALQFNKRYPKAFETYSEFCGPAWKKDFATTSSLVGKTVLISSQRYIYLDPKKKPRPMNRNHYIACLITSNGYGKSVDPPEMILKSTAKALDDLAKQIQTLRKKQQQELDSEGDNLPNDSRPMVEKVPNINVKLGGCRAVRINSGKFGVPWKDTKRILENGPLDIVVVRPKPKIKIIDPFSPDIDERVSGNSDGESSDNYWNQENNTEAGACDNLRENSNEEKAIKAAPKKRSRGKVAARVSKVQRKPRTKAKALNRTKRGIGTRRRGKVASDDTSE